MIPSSIVFTHQVSRQLEIFLHKKNFSGIAVLVDENTEKHCYPLIKGALADHSVIRIKSGEENKNLKTCSAIWQEMTESGFDRKSLLINLGGGVIGDMGGFCAATFKRGLSFLNIPTTLLAQVDASVGGKQGIDFQGYKNHIGVFKDPEMVIISPVFLNTLIKRELRSGFAEIIKHALIADEAYWKVISSRTFEDQEWESHIKHSLEVKSAITQEDPFESGRRKILNFGHTIGHAVESFYLNSGQKLLHGEAIAVGMICEAYLSTIKNKLPNDCLSDIQQYLISIFGKISLEKKLFEEIAAITIQDKKNLNKQVKAALLSRIGHCEFDITIDQKDIISALEYYEGLD